MEWEKSYYNIDVNDAINQKCNVDIINLQTEISGKINSVGIGSMFLGTRKWSPWRYLIKIGRVKIVWIA